MMRKNKHPIFFNCLKLLIVLCALFAPPAFAGNDEYIKAYDVTALFNSDASMEVTEKIVFEVHGIDIKRGILRVIPTTWNRADGKRYRVNIDVSRVQRNGQPEPFTIAHEGNEIEIRMGSSDYMLPHGKHEYTITYTVSNHFSRFPEWDELYWNVTGNEWSFPIHHASFRLLYKDDKGHITPFAYTTAEFYTGSAGSKGQDAALLEDKTIATTAPLWTREGLTVVYTWPRSLFARVADPVQDNPILKTLIPTAGNDEYIETYDVTALFNSDASMEVTEKIAFEVHGIDIKRGILRVIPTTWNRADGKRYRVNIDVNRVQRNGQPEPFTIAHESNKVGIRMGSPDYLLPYGKHEYTITYTVSNHFSRFPEWDELYWNVTGNEWSFPIHHASFRLLYKDDEGHITPFAYTTAEFYTGSAGSKGQDAALLEDKTIATTAPLWTREGLTVVYTWPRSLFAQVADPVQENLILKALIPTSWQWYCYIPMGLSGFLLPLCLPIRSKSSEPVVIPLFNPPDDLSPGSLGYVVKRDYDGECFSADLLRLVYQKVLSLDKGLNLKALKKTDGENKKIDELTGEETLLDFLQEKPKHTVNLKDKKSTEGMYIVKRVFHMEAMKKHGRLLTKKPLIGGIIAALTIFALQIMLIAYVPESFGLIFFFFLAVAPLTMLLTKLLNWIFGESKVLAMLLSISGIAITNIIGVFFLESISSPYPDGYLGIIIASVIIICIFYVLVPRYTQEGKVQLAKAQGLKMYLTTAEKERFELLYPPQDSIERFEQLLPYALALGVGKTWANRFASYLKETGQQAIYFGSAHDWVTLSAMSKSCGLMNSPPSSGSSGGGSSSGSGSSGGGSSGGGSGGGGGSGW